MSKEPVEVINGIPVSRAPENCKTRMIVYLVYCSLCRKSYIGRTAQTLSDRMSGHRSCFDKALDSHEIVDSGSDE